MSVYIGIRKRVYIYIQRRVPRDFTFSTTTVDKFRRAVPHTTGTIGHRPLAIGGVLSFRYIM